VTGLPLLGATGPHLHNGEAAYPAMWAAIENARERVYLSTYIFRPMRRQAVHRRLPPRPTGGGGARVIDGVGELYAFLG
jgi:cardiolipin synthase